MGKPARIEAGTGVSEQEEPHDGFQSIQNPGQMTALLKRLHKNRAPLTVRLAESREEYRSTIVGVDGAEQRLTLDELHPQEAHALIAAGATLGVIAKADGVETRFSVAVECIGVDSGVHCYTAHYPSELFYYQRRDAVRVPISVDQRERAVLIEGERRHELQLDDLSAGGLGGYLTRGAEVERGATLNYELRLVDQAPLSGRVEIRFTELDKANDRQRVGACFVGLKAADRARLERVVLALQRQRLRRE